MSKCQRGAGTPSPVIELNRAVAVGMADGADAALPLVDALRDEKALRDYGLFHAVRGDLLERLGRLPEAGIEYRRAAELAGNARDRDLMRGKARDCGIADA